MNRIKDCWIAFAVIAAVVLIGGCASFPEPGKNNQTLVIGKIVEKGINFDAAQGASVNGTNLCNIEISIKELSSGKEIKLISNGDGIFHSTSMKPGDYELTKFYIRITSGGAWADMWTKPAADKFFTISENRVNNLGGIEWICDKKKGYYYWLNKEYDDVKSNFAKTNPDSAWNNANWENVTFHR
jgi:hypothetical protein